MKPTLAGVPQLLRYLGTFPAPGDVVEALRRGPLGQCGAQAVALAVVTPTRELMNIATIGFTREEDDRYRVFPLTLEAPGTRAVATRRIEYADAEAFPAELMGGLDEQLWREMGARLGLVSIVSAPILYEGGVIGTVASFLDRRWQEDSPETDVITAVAASLALWMSHPRSGVSTIGVPAVREWSLAFTERQRAVLRLVEAGRSNPAIALELGTSESTVKADLQQAMRALRTSDRREAATRARALGLV
jgi:DNA-binding CsgD family transcriptional regulator